MNGRQSAFRVSAHPVAQFLSMIVIGVVLVGVVIMGAFALSALLALFAVGLCRLLGASVVAVARAARHAGRSTVVREPGSDKSARLHRR